MSPGERGHVNGCDPLAGGHQTISHTLGLLRARSRATGGRHAHPPAGRRRPRRAAPTRRAEPARPRTPPSPVRNAAGGTLDVRSLRRTYRRPSDIARTRPAERRSWRRCRPDREPPGADASRKPARWSITSLATASKRSEPMRRASLGARAAAERWEATAAGQIEGVSEVYLVDGTFELFRCFHGAPLATGPIRRRSGGSAEAARDAGLADHQAWRHPRRGRVRFGRGAGTIPGRPRPTR